MSHQKNKKELFFLLVVKCSYVVTDWSYSLAGFLVSMLFGVSPGQSFTLQIFFYPDFLSFSVQYIYILVYTNAYKVERRSSIELCSILDEKTGLELLLLLCLYYKS